MVVTSLIQALIRRKTTTGDQSKEGAIQLARVLNLFDLTALGVGATLGLGVYILAGSVAKTVAGPAVCLSFFVAAFASALAGLCYAEFAARVPKAGSAYVYSYVSVGEFIAYIIGWNLILEYVIGTASVARGLSAYIDELANKTIQTTLTEWLPINVHFLGAYPDLLSVIFIALLTVLLSVGVKESTILNNIFTVLNLATVTTVLVAGALKADPHNWKLSMSEVGPKGGVGGFMPFGVSGVMAGAAKCFYGFVGFDSVATTGEEAKNPQKHIPLAIVFSLLIVFVAYFGISTVLTLMWPYYDQNENAPFPYVFQQVGWITIKWIVTIGAICALCTSLLGAMFPLPRIVYAMASDGLVFKTLSTVNVRTRTPLIATVLSGVLAALMAALFDLSQLIDMMSIGTLLAYTIVAVCVLLLRYQPDFDHDNRAPPHLTAKMKTQQQQAFTLMTYVKLVYNLNGNKYPTNSTTVLTNWSIGIFSIFTICFCGFLIHGLDLISIRQPFYLLLFVLVGATLFLVFLAILRQPVNTEKLSFKVPWVPFLPCVSLMINVYLMMKLDLGTWIRFGVWLLIGFIIYFLYGIRHSEEGRLRAKSATNPIGVTFKIDNGMTEITKF